MKAMKAMKVRQACSLPHSTERDFDRE